MRKKIALIGGGQIGQILAMLAALMATTMQTSLALRTTKISKVPM
jgi:malate/lactate dehydrogenase